jgi:hypothetical protein
MSIIFSAGVSSALDFEVLLLCLSMDGSQGHSAVGTGTSLTGPGFVTVSELEGLMSSTSGKGMVGLIGDILAKEESMALAKAVIEDPRE